MAALHDHVALPGVHSFGASADLGSSLSGVQIASRASASSGAIGLTSAAILSTAFFMSFRIDSRAAADAKVFVSIAQLFRFCPAKGSCDKV